MEINRNLLPISIHDFGAIREKNRIYVDKTLYIPMLLEYDCPLFLARPRRFGKTLFLSTLEAYFSGRVDLFEGLAIEKHMRSAEFKQLPVIRLDMSQVDEVARKSLCRMLSSVADFHELTVRDDSPVDFFNSLVLELKKKYDKKIVILIDEYDAPVLRSIYRGEQRNVEDVRDIMSQFYTQIKASSSLVHFTFITGISKFSRMGIFSGLNTLKEISLMPEYAGLAGYTHEELVSNFWPFVEARAKHFDLAPDEMLDAMQDHYNGFSFDGELLVYNPLSALCFFEETEPKFLDYWVESGSQTFVRHFLRDSGKTIQDFQNISISENTARSPGEIELLMESAPELFLYQAGYLTLRKDVDTKNNFLLVYPNKEVKNSLTRIFLSLFHQNIDRTSSIQNSFRKNFQEKNVDGIIVDLNRFFSGISFKTHNRMEKVNLGETMYQTLMYTFIEFSGIHVQQEQPNNHGQMDIVAQYAGTTIVCELKAARGMAKCQQMVRAGLEQIRERNYGNAYCNPILLSIAFDEETREVGAYAVFTGPDDEPAVNTILAPGQ